MDCPYYQLQLEIQFGQPEKVGRKKVILMLPYSLVFDEEKEARKVIELIESNCARLKDVSLYGCLIIHHA